VSFSVSDQLPYTVERLIDGVEIRRYLATIRATVRDLPDNEAFRILFKFISGNNRPTTRVDALAQTAASGEKIAMTVPVLSTSDSFSFLMPPSFSIESTPEPRDPRSVVEQMPERRVAAIRFSGVARERAVASRTRQLLETLADLRPIGTPFLMRYNPPFTPGFLRRNEVGVELMPVDQ